MRPLAAQAVEEVTYASAGVLPLAVLPGAGLCALVALEPREDITSKRDKSRSSLFAVLAGGSRHPSDPTSLYTALRKFNAEAMDLLSPHVRRETGLMSGGAAFAASDAVRMAVMREYVRAKGAPRPAAGGSADGADATVPTTATTDCGDRDGAGSQSDQESGSEREGEGESES